MYNNCETTCCFHKFRSESRNRWLHDLAVGGKIAFIAYFKSGIAEGSTGKISEIGMFIVLGHLRWKS